MDPKVAKQVNGFFNKYKVKTFKKGQYLIKGGEVPKGVFCLQKGIVRSVNLLNGSEVTINLFKPISFFPTNWVVNDKLELYNFEALTDVEVFIAPKRKFLSFLKKTPPVLFDLLKRVYRGLEGYQLRIESLLSNNNYYKVLVQLLISARRFGETDGERGLILRMNNNDIASLTGLSAEIVSKEIRRLQRKRLVKSKGNYFIIPKLDFLEYETFQA